MRHGDSRGRWRLWQASAGPGHPNRLSPARVLVCLLTTTVRDTPLYRLTLPAEPGTGLREPSQVTVDKIMAVRRDRCGPPIGRADEAALIALGRLLALVVGIAD